jgi:hypothetical protein
MAFLAHVVLVIAFVQMPFYGWLPVQIQTLMIACALGWRALEERARERVEERSTWMLEPPRPSEPAWA